MTERQGGLRAGHGSGSITRGSLGQAQVSLQPQYERGRKEEPVLSLTSSHFTLATTCEANTLKLISELGKMILREGVIWQRAHSE